MVFFQTICTNITLMATKYKKKFKFQLNASSIGKLLGYLGRERQKQALAECWLMNVKRMPRFGVTPAEVPSKPTVSEVVQQSLSSRPVYKQMVQRGISSCAEQRAVTKQIKETASNEVKKAKRKYEELDKVSESLKKMKIIPEFKTKKSGTKRVAIGSFFMSNQNIYHKTSSKTARKSDIETAIKNGYQLEQHIQTQTAKINADKKEAKQEIQKTTDFESNVVQQATKAINTQRGIQKELTDLELVQKRFPTVRAGNDRAYFMHIRGQPWGAFIIGKIDGISAGIVFELKHRQARLFNEMRRYELVQCAIYIKMVKMPQCMLVETYEGQQNYYQVEFDASDRLRYRKEGGEWISSFYWSDIENGIAQIVSKLNRAEKDQQYRDDLKKILF